jgi:hypothetical protein
MANVILITVIDSDDIVTTGMYGASAVTHVQSSSASDGTYADLSGTGSTPTVTIVSGTTYYKAYDPNGSTTTWYRARYENSGATRYSDWTDPFKARAD